MEAQQHTPVLVEEIIAHFKPNKGDALLDATLGLGGHAKAFLQSAEETTVLGFDADDRALSVAAQRLNEFENRVTLINTNFNQMQEALREHNIRLASFTHILFDLGIGSHQLADEDRGFSFRSEGPFSMKYGHTINMPLADVESLNVLTKKLNGYPDVLDIIQGLSTKELAHVIRTYGEERYAYRIAKTIQESDIKTGHELSDHIAHAVPHKGKERIHPATRTFLALRLAVNRELEVLKAALPQAVDELKPNGILAVISFHSLEDRITKHFFREQAKDCICPPLQPVCTCNHKAQLTIKTKRPITAGKVEQKRNPRSRSAKLRIAVKRE